MAAANTDAAGRDAGYERAETDRWRRGFWKEMLERDGCLSQNQFVSASHAEEDVERTVETHEEAL